MGTCKVTLAFFLPYTVTHMCHDMTGLAIMAGRLGAKTFCWLGVPAFGRSFVNLHLLARRFLP